MEEEVENVFMIPEGVFILIVRCVDNWNLVRERWTSNLIQTATTIMGIVSTWYNVSPPLLSKSLLQCFSLLVNWRSWCCRHPLRNCHSELRQRKHYHKYSEKDNKEQKQFNLFPDERGPRELNKFSAWILKVSCLKESLCWSKYL